MQPSPKRAFTLIEMLVVIVVIGVLSGIVFRMISIVSRHGDRAGSLAKIQRVANAVEGFYAEYGQYPPVPDYGEGQPFYYEFPWKGGERGMDGSLALALYNNNPPPDEARIFTFGLLAFLVDRYDRVEDVKRDYPDLFKTDQWEAHNSSTTISSRDRAALQKWAPQLDGILGTDGKTRNFKGRIYVNRAVTVKDAWNRSLRYTSPPPYQQYRVWTKEPGTNKEIGSGRWDN